MAKMLLKDKNTQLIQKELYKLENKGYDVNIALDGKSIDYYARNKKSMEKFNYNVQVAKERPSIERTLNRMNEKSLDKVKTQIGKEVLQQKVELRSKVSKESFNELSKVNGFKQFQSLDKIKDLKSAKQFLKDIKNSKRLVDLADEYTLNKSNTFLDKYFKLLGGHKKNMDKLDTIKSLIGNDLGYLGDVADIITSNEFKGDYDSASARSGLIHYTDSYAEMEERLNKLLGLVMEEKAPKNIEKGKTVTKKGR